MNEEAVKKLASYVLELAEKVRKLERDAAEMKNVILSNCDYKGWAERETVKFLLFKK